MISNSEPPVSYFAKFYKILKPRDADIDNRIKYEDLHQDNL